MPEHVCVLSGDTGGVDPQPYIQKPAAGHDKNKHAATLTLTGKSTTPAIHYLVRLLSQSLACCALTQKHRCTSIFKAMLTKAFILLFEYSPHFYSKGAECKKCHVSSSWRLKILKTCFSFYFIYACVFVCV